MKKIKYTFLLTKFWIPVHGKINILVSHLPNTKSPKKLILVQIKLNDKYFDFV